jgi:hypothetical protein
MRRARRRGKPTLFQKVAEEVFGAARPRRLLPFLLAARAWRDIVGDDLARRARPTGVHRGVLTVEASNGSWMFQLQQMKETLLERIRQTLGEEAGIEDIRIHLAREEFRPIRARASFSEKRRSVNLQAAQKLLDVPAMEGKDALREALLRLMTLG